MKKFLMLFVFIGLNYNYSTLFSQKQGQSLIDSLVQVLPKAKEDTNKANILIDISFEYCRINPDKGIYFGNQGLELARKLDWKFGISSCLNSIGMNYYSKNEYQKAYEYCQNALEVHKKIKDKKGLAVILNNLGNTSLDLQMFPEAINYYQQALKIYEATDNKIGTARLHRNIGIVFNEISELPKALEYYQKALKLSEELDNKYEITMNLGCIGNVYHDLKDLGRSLDYYKKALKLFEEQGDRMSVAIALGNIGSVYGELFNYPKALEYYENALKNNIELRNVVPMATNYGNIGEIYYRLTQDTILAKLSEIPAGFNTNKLYNLKNSIRYFLKAIEIDEEIGQKVSLILWYNNLQLAYRDLGNYDEAYKYLAKWTELKDSVFTTEKAKQIATLEAKREKELAEKELLIQKSENIRKRNESYFLYLGLACLAVISIIIFNQRKKSEKLLLNILPAKIARRLKRKEKYIADRFEEASVIFIDQVDFTTNSSKTSPEKVVEILNNVYKEFDNLAAKYNLEKIKTIGDCYMAAAGLPEPCEEHAE